MEQGVAIIRNHFGSFVLAIIAGFAVFFVNKNILGPMIQPDEGSYLAIAAALAGYPNDLAGSYYAGYPILIAPAYWVSSTPHHIWEVVRSINAALFSLTVIGLWFLAKHLAPTHSVRQRYVAVIIVSVYPAWVILVGYSSAQIAFIPVFLLTTLAYIKSIRGGIKAWFTLGVVSGFLSWIHPTAVAPMIAVILGTGYIAIKRSRYNLFAVLLLTIMSMVIVYQYVINVWIQKQMSISDLPPNLHYPGLLQFLSPLTTLKGLFQVMTHITGQLFYFSLGTVGLLWLGLLALTKKLNGITRTTDNLLYIKEHALALFICLSFTGTLVLTAVFFSTPLAQRLDHWLYGRYVEGVIAPILLAGALSVSFRKVLWVVPISVLCTFILSPEISNYTHVIRANIPAFWQDYFFRAQGIWVWLTTGVILLITVAVLPHKIGALFFISIFSFSSYLHINWHAQASQNESSRVAAAFTVREQFEPGTCVGFDHSSIDSYNKHVFWFDFGFVLYDYLLQRSSFEHWLNTCNGPFVSYGKDMSKQNSSVYLFTTSPQNGPLVWMNKCTGEASVSIKNCN